MGFKRQRRGSKKEAICAVILPILEPSKAISGRTVNLPTRSCRILMEFKESERREAIAVFALGLEFGGEILRGMGIREEQDGVQMTEQ